MKISFLNYRFTICFLFVLGAGLSACKKNNADSNPTTGQPGTGTRRQLTLDSLFLYAKQMYYWNDAIPDYNTFNPRQFSSKSVDLDNYNAELFALTQLKINPTTGKPYELYPFDNLPLPKYSFIDDLTQANPSVSSSINDQADVDTEGNGNDIGIRGIFFLTTNSESGPYQLFVTAVYPGSPAAAAGVQRGWWIQKINGTTIGTNYTNDNVSIEASLNSASVKIEGVNFVDNVPFSLTLNKASYKSSPVYASKVITASGKKIGYLSFARFSVLSNPSETSPSDINLDPVFANFSTQGITDLIVDLRYNGGGYINTAEYLADLIAPSGTTGKKMYSEIYNTTMQSGQATILKNQPALSASGKLQYKSGNSGAFYTLADQDYSAAGAANNANFTKKGSLNTVNNVVFIVSGNTASASELLINVLKPYLTVSLVGKTTYGKPVGFFPIVLENRYQVYMPQFETRNANNEGGYYTGMVPGTSVNDDPRYPFGDTREANLAAALNLIAPGAVISQSPSSSVNARTAPVPSLNFMQVKPVNPGSEFTGMIGKRPALKK